ncbi:ubiquitin, putative [Eimeria tenella]|uniref:Ubiquitin, putative n=1 Tax=Eimeria tenella TaxID=5802 RepID=U6KYJ4_EIMTE|nr:ubiquitin, putative [Eimeria tenella]CDJ43026.1 ubiquitin, putative [Eimeria tenella]|eukprot:XP_013233776.1 ubiquitin, putative [Eimeria tenella]
MPTTEVTLVLSDWTKGNNGKKFELPHIQMTSPIVEVKKSVIQALDASDLKPESILLFIGSLVLRDDKLLKDYNKSGRSKLSVDVYERVDLNLKVKTLQNCGAGACVCIPIWSFLCRQTINVTIASHETVGDLKQRVAEELDDPDRYSADKIRLTFNNNMLFDDSQVLKDVGMKNNSTVTILVDCCYWAKPRKQANKPAGDAPPKEEKEAEGEQEQAAVEGSAVDPSVEQVQGSVEGNGDDPQNNTEQEAESKPAPPSE